MNIEEINNKIQTENDSYNRDLNRLQQQIQKLKQRHQRTMAYWQNKKAQEQKHYKQECCKCNLAKQIAKLNEELKKYLN